MKNERMDMETLETLMESFPAKLVAMTYDEAIRALKETIAAIEAGDIAKRFAATTRVADIVEVLHASLDKEEGGEIADNLDQLYTYIITQLPMINIHNDTGLAQNLIGLLTPLRDSWAELDERIQHDVAQAEHMTAGFAHHAPILLDVPLAGAA